MAEADLTKAQAKLAVQMTLYGSNLTLHRENGFVKAFGYDATRRLEHSTLHAGLASDFKIFWRELKGLNTTAGLDFIADGESIGQSLTTFYFRLEDEVMTVIDNTLRAGGTKVWFVHDGFLSKEPVQTEQLEQEVFFRTGFEIRLEQTDLCTSV
jgi:hypothetical protein